MYHHRELNKAVSISRCWDWSWRNIKTNANGLEITLSALSAASPESDKSENSKLISDDNWWTPNHFDSQALDGTGSRLSPVT